MPHWILPPLLLACLLLAPPIALAWQGKVVHVTDGDTLVVLKGPKEVDIRLYGVDTPEKEQNPSGPKPSDSLQALLVTSE